MVFLNHPDHVHGLFGLGHGVGLPLGALMVPLGPLLGWKVDMILDLDKAKASASRCSRNENFFASNLLTNNDKSHTEKRTSSSFKKCAKIKLEKV